MSEINKFLKMIDEINDDCEDILDLRHKADLKYKKEKTNIEMESEDLIEEMRKSLKDFEKKNFEPITNEFDKVIAVLATDYQSEAKDTKIDKKEFSNYSIEECNNTLNDIVAELNAHIAELNAVDLDVLIPPVKIAIEGETFYTYTEENGKIKDYNCDSKPSTGPAPKPLVELAKKIFVLCERGKACVERIAQIYRDQINVDEYEARVRSGAATWLSEKKQSIENEYSNALYKRFDSDESKKKYDAFFSEMQDKAKEAEVDATTGALSDSESIVIGRARIKVANDSKYNDVISESSALSKYLNAGGFLAPVTLDLKKCGNVMLELDEEDDYSSKAKTFIEQMVIQFLLAFPANKMKFRLIDTANKIGFSAFKMLTKINTDILLDGIVRDDRKLEDAIKDMEQLMYDIEDNKLSYNNVDDIFEYNKAFETNPQNLHLFVLVDFPNNIREDLAQRIMKIIQNGNRVGIFTVFVYNKAVEPDYNFSAEKLEKFIDNVKKYSLCVKQDWDSLALDIPRENVFVPDKRITTDMLPQIIEVMQNNAESTKQKNVLLDTMFEETDRVANSAKGIGIAAEVLDIPIGVRGGEIQTLKLETNGGVSPHAVAIGGTGSGKSNLLHTIIMNTCYKYSPEDVNLYLIDFKGGNEFKFYEANKVVEKQIPHIKLTGLTSDVEDGIAILNNLQNVLADRQEKFRQANVSDIVQYCNAGYKMPRLFVIVDEIQELFEQDDKLGQKAIDILRELFKLGRAYGITILWASQNIPNAPGLRDKILSQIGNRISLKLNEPDDALDIHIDPKMVKALNRPEKGLGVINDSRTGNDCFEFRVAYAENVANRQKYAEAIVNKWKSVSEKLNDEPLFIVGDNETPSPIVHNSIFASTPSKESIVSKAFETYSVQFGQNFITGKPFNMGIEVRANKSNIAFMGSDVEVVRDMMGYSLMSVVMEQITNADCKMDSSKIYYANGEMVNPKNSSDLFNVAKEDFSNIVENVSSSDSFKETVKTLYKIYKDRQEESENLNEAKAYAPYFFVIHSLQRYIDLFESNPTLNLNEGDDTASGFNLGTGNASSFFDGLQGFGTPSNNSNSDSVAFVDAFKELMGRAGQFGIHFIVSLDNPEAIRNIRDELYSFNYKVFSKGINATIISQVLGTYGNNAISNPEIALVTVGEEKYKVRMYRYDADTDSVWYKGLASKYLAL